MCVQISGLDLSQNSQIDKHLGNKKSLPVSVEWASDIKRIGASFVVSSRAEAIHEAAVGKRCLYKEQKNKSVFINSHYTH